MDFHAWLKDRRIRESLVGSPADRFRFSPGHDVAGDHERDLKELAKLLFAKYHEQFSEFVSKLGTERGDEEITSLLRRIQGGSANPDPWTVRRHVDLDDDIARPSSDTGGDPFE